MQFFDQRRREVERTEEKMTDEEAEDNAAVAAASAATSAADAGRHSVAGSRHRESNRYGVVLL